MKYTWQFLIFILVGFLVYVNSFNNEFVWDDDHFIWQNKFVAELSWENVQRIFTSNTIAGAGQLSDYYRPLTSLSFAVDHFIWNWNTFGFHLTNTLMHIGNAILLFLLLHKLGLGKNLSFWITLIFLVHPVNVEAVTYLASRGSVFYPLLFLASLYAFVHSLEKDKLKLRLLLSLSLGLFALSILAKEAGVATIPIFLGTLLLEKVKKGLSLKHLHELYRSQIIAIMLMVLVVIGYVYLRLTYLDFHNFFNYTNYNDIYIQSFWVRIYTFFKIIWLYIKLIFAPYPLYLERSTQFVVSPFSWWVISGFILVMVTFLLGIWEAVRKKTAWIIFGGIWLGSHLLSVSGLIPQTYLYHENWLYMPLIGFFVVFYGLWTILIPKNFTKHFFIPINLLLIAVSIVLGSITIYQNTKWKDRVTLFEHNLKYQEHAKLHLNLGNAYLGKGELDKAETHLQKALMLKDVYPQTHFNLGNLYLKEGDKDLAEKEFLKSLELDPYYLYSYPMLIDIYLQKKLYKEALMFINGLSAVYPNDLKIIQVEGGLLFKLGQKEKAEEKFTEALKISKDSEEVRKTIEQIKSGDTNILKNF